MSRMNEERKRQRKARQKRQRLLARGSAAFPEPPLDEHEVVGYTARIGGEMLCTEDLCCVVCESPAAIMKRMEESGIIPVDYAIEPATAGHILEGMRLGGEYSMDPSVSDRLHPHLVASGVAWETLMVKQFGPND